MRLPTQRRTAIIRGRSQRDLEALISGVASFVVENTPSEIQSFEAKLDSHLNYVRPGNIEKTIRNYRTEIVHKLLGLYHVSDGVAHASDRTSVVIESGDYPQFFRDMLMKLQFPNPMSKPQTLAAEIADKLRIRPAVLVCEVLRECRELKTAPTLDEIGVFALNSLDALKGVLTGAECARLIRDSRAEGLEVRVGDGIEGARSLHIQHITEFLSYMELGGLISRSADGREYMLQPSATAIIESFISVGHTLPLFDLAELPNRDIEGEWEEYFGGAILFSDQANPTASVITTSAGAIRGNDNIDLGRQGEKLVYELERERLSSTPRYLGRVKDMAAMRGIGYDIQTVSGVLPEPDRFKFLEVKSTRRTTKPADDDYETVSLTPNEWRAATQYGEDYSIVRVIFHQGGHTIREFKNPASWVSDGRASLEPTGYTLEVPGTALGTWEPEP